MARHALLPVQAQRLLRVRVGLVVSDQAVGQVLTVVGGSGSGGSSREASLSEHATAYVAGCAHAHACGRAFPVFLVPGELGDQAGLDVTTKYGRRTGTGGTAQGAACRKGRGNDMM